MAVNWSRLENRLYDLSVDALRSFAAGHPDEVFYGFMFDCNGEYGDVGLCLNTEEDLRETIRKRYSHYSQEMILELRWCAGDWKYQGFNTNFDELSQRFRSGWEALQEKVQDQCDEDDEDCDEDEDENPTVIHFLESVCRVLLRMEATDAFACLHRTADFGTLVCDHDESLEDARSRLNRIRQGLDPRRE